MLNYEMSSDMSKRLFAIIKSFNYAIIKFTIKLEYINDVQIITYTYLAVHRADYTQIVCIIWRNQNKFILTTLIIFETFIYHQ